MPPCLWGLSCSCSSYWPALMGRLQQEQLQALGRRYEFPMLVTSISTQLALCVSRSGLLDMCIPQAPSTSFCLDPSGRCNHASPLFQRRGTQKNEKEKKNEHKPDKTQHKTKQPQTQKYSAEEGCFKQPSIMTKSSKKRLDNS